MSAKNGKAGAVKAVPGTASPMASPRASRTASPASPKAIRIDFTGARSKDAMLAVAAKALKFPRHFGGNLDALHDCLTDIKFGPAGAAITLVKLAHTPCGDAVHDVFRAATRYWAKQGAKVTLVRQ